MKLKKLMKKVLKRVHKLMAIELKRYQKEDEVLAEFDKCQGVVFLKWKIVKYGML